MAEDLDRIVPLQTSGSLPPLYCVHAVSGSAYSYAGLARMLGPDQPVYGIEAPGFDNERQPIGSLPALAEEYTALVREFSRQQYGVDGGYCLLGWSIGGTLAFEMAKRLVAAGVTVSRLVLVDAGLPTVMPLPPEREILRRYVRDIMGRSEDSPPELDAVLEGLPADVAPEVVFEAVERAGILPEEIDADLLATQYAVFRAHLSALYSMELAGSYDGPVTHLLATQSPPEEDMRWSSFAPDLIEATMPGTHHSIWTGDNLAVLAEAVRQSLSREGVTGVDQLT